jgi:hypothetical protein
MRTHVLLFAVLMGSTACGGKISTGSLDTGDSSVEPSADADADADGTDADGTDADGTDTGGDADGTDADGTDADGTDADGTDADGTDADGTDADGTDADGTDADGTDADGTDADDGGSPEGFHDVADFQTDSLTDGTAVTLNNVVVTSTMSIEAPGFYVQDVGGGEWSGVFVFTQPAETAAGSPDPAAVSVSIGDVLNLSGTSVEFFGQTQLVLAEAGDLTVVGTGASVAVTALDATPSDWEPYEGVLVSMTDVTITDVPDPLEDEHAPVTDKGLSVADQLMEISMSEGDFFTSITGIVTYLWDLYRIAPRSAADIVE